MSLHGSLETFALTDVLALLSSTHKTGELRIVGDRSQGSVWVDAGRLVQTAVHNATTHVDALFELLRLPSGMFTFEQGLSAPDPGEPLILEALVAKAEERLREWRSIEAVVPSAAVAVRLEATVGGDVAFTPEQWRMLVAAVDGGTVTSVCERMELGEFDACKGVRDLVQMGVVRVEEPEAPKKPAKAEHAAKVDPPAPVVDDGDDDEDGPDPLEALAAVAAANAVDETGDDGEDGGTDSADDDADGTSETVDEIGVLPGQPLPAWALEDDGEDAEAADDAEPVDEPRLRSLATAVESDDPEAIAAAAAAFEAGELGENGEEPINRGLLLKFLSSVRS